MKTMTFEYIEVFYNRRRLHSTLGYSHLIWRPDRGCSYPYTTTALTVRGCLVIE